METLKLVLKRLQDVGLKMKLTKCEFLKPRIKFLESEVDEQGIHTVDDKIAAVAKFPHPKTVENVRSFLRLAGYYRPFLKNFAARGNPLTQLLKKDTPFHWGSEQESSFKDLKHALAHAPVLDFPISDDPFIIFTDASGAGIGAVLTQADNAGKQHVIAFARCALTAAEKIKYLVTHLEILAVVWALRHFRDIIMGYKITVYTDHCPITDTFKGRNLNGRLVRWYLTIQAYSTEIKYTKGCQNVVADSLCRNICVAAVAEASLILNFSMEDLCSAQ